jgi:hypothetical protein
MSSIVHHKLTIIQYQYKQIVERLHPLLFLYALIRLLNLLHQINYIILDLIMQLVFDEHLYSSPFKYANFMYIIIYITHYMIWIEKPLTLVVCISNSYKENILWRDLYVRYTRI